MLVKQGHSVEGGRYRLAIFAKLGALSASWTS